MERFSMTSDEYNDAWLAPNADGEWVLYAAVQRAIAEARNADVAEARRLLATAQEWLADRDAAYEQGQRDERARIRAAVLALPTWGESSDQATTQAIDRDSVLAIIDAGGES